MKKLIDPLTNEPFLARTRTQKFSDRENQVRYNNLKATQNRRQIAPVMNILSNNRRILSSILQGLDVDKEVVVSRDFLLGAGYRFDYCTQYKKIKEQEYYHCFEYYLTQTNNKYRIGQIPQ